MLTPLTLLIILAAVGVVAVALAVITGVFRRRSVVGPGRLAPGQALSTLFMSMLIGVGLWIFIANVAYVALGGGPRSTREGPATQPSTAPATARSSTGPASAPAAGPAMSATTGPTTGPTSAPATQPGTVVAVPAPADPAAPGIDLNLLQTADLVGRLIAFAGMLIALAILAGAPALGSPGIGVLPRNARTGIWRGAVGAVMMIWLVFVVNVGTDIVWRLVHYHHPREHDLLRTLGESRSPLLSALLIAAAVVAAPLFEEVVFRGHLQTLLTYGLHRLRRRRWSGDGVGPSAWPGLNSAGFPLAAPTAPLNPYALPSLPHASHDLDQPASRPSAGTRWAAILLTSILFSVIHPAWTIPPIFVLSLCVGYAYERTGNLWVPITMHALFNATSTVLFLVSRGAM